MQGIMVSSPSPKTRNIVMGAASLIVVILIAIIVILASYWPFSRSAVVKELGDAIQSKVEVGAFHATYFPRPGCILEHVTVQHNPKAGTRPLITVERLAIEGTFSGLFMKHVKRIRAEGMRVLVPAPGSDEHFQTPKRSPTVIDELIADGATLEVASRDSDQPPLKFPFPNFVLRDVGSHGPSSFQARLSNPEPPGEIVTSGKFGPWNEDDVGKTGVSGEYLFQQADLGVFRGIAGILSSSGKFSGVLNHIEVQGTTDTPSFKVTSSSHEVQLRTEFHAVVNGENGDTFLQNVAATFLKTTVSSEGSVAGTAGQTGKTASIELAAKGGRIQDLLLLFVRSDRAPMSGTVGFHANVSIPPEKRPFLERVEMQGDFGIDAGSFTKPDTQQGVNRLSKGALGEGDHHKAGGEADDPATVLSDLKGHVRLKDGTARFSGLSFSIPGALAQLQGTYNLLTQKIDMHGTLRTDSDPSATTQGVKALMLKVLDPFFKKKHAGYLMPIKIAGTFDRPSFGLDLVHQDDKKPHKENVQIPGFGREAGPDRTGH
jgi:hypothetical protein